MNNVQLFEMSKKQSTKPRGKWQVSVLNDDYNTFDHVIDSLMEICNHSYLQAVQCSTLIHQTGKSSVYIDQWNHADEVYHDLQEEGLTVIITKYISYEQMDY